MRISDWSSDVCSSDLRGRAPVDGIGRALVEHHDDIGIQRALDAHGLFRRKKKPGAVYGRSELDAFFGELAQAVQAEYLEAARVGPYGPVPLHESVQAILLLSNPGSRPQQPIEGIVQE